MLAVTNDIFAVGMLSREREEIVAKTYSLEELRSMAPDARAVLYQNALKRLDQGGQAIVDMIDQNGLSLSSGGMLTSDPDYIRMDEIIWARKPEALKAVEAGLPALAGIEPFIRAELGDRYRPQNGGTLNAGYLTAGLMRHLGFVDDGPGEMPAGSVAKPAMKWKLRPR
jgi:hypothetical protein